MSFSDEFSDYTPPSAPAPSDDGGIGNPGPPPQDNTSSYSDYTPSDGSRPDEFSDYTPAGGSFGGETANTATYGDYSDTTTKRMQQQVDSGSLGLPGDGSGIGNPGPPPQDMPRPAGTDNRSWWERGKDLVDSAAHEAGDLIGLGPMALKDTIDAGNRPWDDPGAFLKDAYGSAAGTIGNTVKDAFDVGSRIQGSAAVALNDAKRGNWGQLASDVNPASNAYYAITGDQAPWMGDEEYTTRNVVSRNPAAAILPGSGGSGEGPQVVPDSVPIIGGDSLYDLPVVGGVARAGAALKGSLTGDAASQGPSLDVGALQNDVANGMPYDQAIEKYKGSVGASILSDLINPVNFVEVPGVGEAVASIFETKTARALGEIAHTTDQVGAWTPQAADATKQALTDSGKVFDLSKPNQVSQATEIQAGAIAGLNHVSTAPEAAAIIYDGAARFAEGDTARATEYANYYVRNIDPTANVDGVLDTMQRTATGAQSSLGRGGVPDPQGAASLLDAKAEAIRAMGAGDLSTVPAREAAAKLGVDLNRLAEQVRSVNPDIYDRGIAARQQVAALAARDTVKDDLRAGWYAESGYKLPGSETAFTQGMQGIFSIVRGLMLAGSAPPLALQKFADEWFRAMTQGTMAIRLSDTATAQAVARFAERRNVLGLGAKAQGFLDRSTVGNLLKSDILPPTVALRDVNPLTFRGAFTGQNRYGEAIRPGERFQALASPVDKWNQSLIAAPTQHVQLNALYQDTNPKALAARRAAAALQMPRQLPPVVPERGMAQGRPAAPARGENITPRVTQAIRESGGEPGLVAATQELPRPTGRTIPINPETGKALLPNEIAPEKYAALQEPTPSQPTAATLAENQRQIAAIKARAEEPVQPPRLTNAQRAQATDQAIRAAGGDLTAVPKEDYIAMRANELRTKQVDYGKASASGNIAPRGRGVYASDKARFAQEYDMAVADKAGGGAGGGGPSDMAAGGGDFMRSPLRQQQQERLYGEAGALDAGFGGGRGGVRGYGESQRTPRSSKQGALDLAAGVQRGNITDALRSTGSLDSHLATIDPNDLQAITVNQVAANTEIKYALKELEAGKHAGNEAAVYHDLAEMDDFANKLADMRARIDPTYTSDRLNRETFGSTEGEFKGGYGIEGMGPFAVDAMPGWQDQLAQARAAAHAPQTQQALDEMRSGRTPAARVEMPNIPFPDRMRELIGTPEPFPREGSAMPIGIEGPPPLGREGPPPLGQEGPPVTPAMPTAAIPATPSPLPHVPDHAAAQAAIQQAAAPFGAGDQAAVRAGLQRGYRIVGNNADQTTAGMWMKNGFGGVTPPVLPFAPFHIHSAQFWAQYFAAHPALALGMAQVLQNFDDYGTLKLPGGNTVAGLIKLTTGLHVLDWAQKAYQYATDVNAQGGNSIPQQILKNVNYDVFGNNAFVRPFEYVSGPVASLTQRTTNPLLSGKLDYDTKQPLPDSRDLLREYGSMNGTTGFGQTLNDLTGQNIPRNVISGITNPGQALGNQLQRGTDALFGVDRQEYNPDLAAAHALGFVADQQGLSKYAAEKAYYNPTTPQEIALGKQLHDAVNRRLDTQAMGKLAPVQANAAQSAMETKGIYAPKDAKGYMLDMPIGAGGFTAKDLLNQPGNYYNTLDKITAAKAQYGANSPQVRALEGELAKIRAADVAQSPGALGPYFDTLKQDSLAKYGDQTFRGTLKPNEQNAYDAFNDLRGSADYRRYEQLVSDEYAAGPFGSAGEKAWYNANKDELNRLKGIVTGAEQSIVDRYGVNPKELANRAAVAAGRAPTYTNTDISTSTATSGTSNPNSNAGNKTSAPTSQNRPATSSRAPSYGTASGRGSGSSPRGNTGTSARSASSSGSRTATGSGSQQAGNSFFDFYRTITDKGEKAAVLNALDRAGVNPIGQKGVGAQTFTRALAVAQDALTAKRAANLVDAGRRAYSTPSSGTQTQGARALSLAELSALMERTTGIGPAQADRGMLGGGLPGGSNRLAPSPIKSNLPGVAAQPKAPAGYYYDHSGRLQKSKFAA